MAKLNVIPGMEAFAADDAPKAKYAPKGYAAPPGTGPKGETCATCRHLVRSAYARKRYLKCGLIRYRWTFSYGTDVRAGSPACRVWEARPDEAKGKVTA
jgi:hypothetical protein